jgi:hypothetical protein
MLDISKHDISTLPTLCVESKSQLRGGNERLIHLRIGHMRGHERRKLTEGPLRDLNAWIQYESAR